MSFSLAIKHNIEVAHRLSKSPGKCEAIHGHSMKVTLEIFSQSQLNAEDVMDGMMFGDMKKVFRHYLDTTFDHHLLLNAEDIWAKPIYRVDRKETGHGLPEELEVVSGQTWLPGLTTFDGDPTTENIAKTIGKWAQGEFGVEFMYDVLVWETDVNAARYRA